MPQKRPVALAVSFLIGVGVTAAMAYAKSEMDATMGSLHLRSDVHFPLRSALDDINAAIEKGDTDLAITKIKRLQSGWRAYLDGGEAPEQFVPGIIALPSQDP